MITKVGTVTIGQEEIQARDFSVEGNEHAREILEWAKKRIESAISSEQANAGLTEENRKLHQLLTIVRDRVGPWISAALDDPKVCKEMKDDINAYFVALDLYYPYKAMPTETKETFEELTQELFNLAWAADSDSVYEWVEQNLIIPNHHYWYEKMGDEDHKRITELVWFIDRVKNSEQLKSGLLSMLKRVGNNGKKV